MNTIGMWFNFSASIIILVSSLSYLKLYLSIKGECSRMYLRQYVLERQINYIIETKELDKDYLKSLRTTYEQFGIGK